MRLGIDFGTTRTRVAAAISGNYPLIDFFPEGGYHQNWYPSIIAVSSQEVMYGLAAQGVQYDSEWEFCRSIKRFLSDCHPQTVLAVGPVKKTLLEWLTGFLTSLREDLLCHSSLQVHPNETLEALVGVPTNSNSNQRFLTLEAFRRAGFQVIGMLNEPSAAGLEYAYRYRQSNNQRDREHLVVYDLGGGTFDISVICMNGRQHEVIGSEGITRLGGDDFDALLMESVLSQPWPSGFIRKRLSLALSGILTPPFGSAVRSSFLNVCREAKEALNPNTRKIMVDLSQVSAALDTVLVPISEFYEKCSPLISRTIQATESALRTALGEYAPEHESLSAVYLVGGSCGLPLLARSLREHFGRRVCRSPYPFAATAMGLAIAADQESGYSLTEQFSRHFGVWRETDDGEKMIFDPVFPKTTGLPRPGQPPLRVTRSYHPAHNLGHFRFLECSNLKPPYQPDGDVVSWDEVYFPFDPALAASECGLERKEIRRWAKAQSLWVEEAYECDAEGIITVTITNHTTGQSKAYRIRQETQQRSEMSQRAASSRS
ncbi:MAG: Hsp70 family protein [Acidobacteria bacterium]|nr:Hsp70 family protein [Acidobacteriota bacterium]MCI0626582.1 Hsp70 family protein [Acidobacteriota bacterium]MCI0720752.1 Hsp70 family protein [Acidobacteriota bacterium]